VANDIVPHAICCHRHWNVWSSSGASMPCPDHLPCDDDRVTVEHLGGAGEWSGTPAERQNGDETSEHSATARCHISGGA
jgi:hypothetical protein